MSGNVQLATDVYQRARAFMFAAGLEHEIEWQHTRKFETFTEVELLRESAWVILCSGFRESIVRRRFGYISLCFCDWESAEEIIRCASLCRASALAAFKNSRKLDAILAVAQHLCREGFEPVKKRILTNPIVELQKLPYIGGVTAWHLAKNLGYPAAKPDRHLVHLSALMGFRDAHELCNVLAEETGEKPSVVDLVLWRYAAEVQAG